jgi:hypothetical protein
VAPLARWLARGKAAVPAWLAEIEVIEGHLARARSGLGPVTVGGHMQASAAAWVTRLARRVQHLLWTEGKGPDWQETSPPDWFAIILEALPPGLELDPRDPWEQRLVREDFDYVIRQCLRGESLEAAERETLGDWATLYDRLTTPVSAWPDPGKAGNSITDVYTNCGWANVAEGGTLSTPLQLALCRSDLDALCARLREELGGIDPEGLKAQVELEFAAAEGASVDTSNWPTLDQAAAMLQKSKATVSKAASAGKLRSVKHGKFLRIDPRSIAEYQLKEVIKISKPNTEETNAEVEAKLARAKRPKGDTAPPGRQR